MSQPRIIAGSAKGRALEIPKQGTRPSPARLREALFNILAFEEKGRFLDLYAGTGAIALEAASRGWQATCVEIGAQASSVIRRNAYRLGLEVDSVQTDALRFVTQHPQSFQIVFAAPPYPLELEPIFQDILDSQVAMPKGMYVFQYPKGLSLHLSYQGEVLELKERNYGSNSIAIIEA